MSAAVTELPGRSAPPPKAVLPGIPPDGDRVAWEFGERLRHHLKAEPSKETAALVRELAEAWQHAMSAHGKVWAKPSEYETDLARYDKVHKAVAPKLAGALAKAEATLEALRAQPDPREEAVAKLGAPADNPVAELRQAEMRSYLRSLAPDERAKVLGEAVEAGDVTVLGAVLAAPAMLSGLGANELAALRHRAVTKLDPAAIAEAARREKLEIQMELIIGQFRSWTRQQFPEPPQPPQAA